MRTPRGLKAAGKRLWTAVTDAADADLPDLVLLEQTCRTIDLLADLRAEVAKTGLMVETSQGVRVHPAAVEARQLTSALSKMVAAMKLPAGLVK